MDPSSTRLQSRDCGDIKGTEYNVADHLSRLENMKVDRAQPEVSVCFLDEVVLNIDDSTPWYAGIVNFLVCKQLPTDYNTQQKKKLMHECKFYY